MLDPFAGSGTTGVAAENLMRNAYLIDAKREYFEASMSRLNKTRAKSRERVFVDCKEATGCLDAPENVSSQPALFEKSARYSK